MKSLFHYSLGSSKSGYHCDLDKFMSDIGPWMDVKLTFDTSEITDGTLKLI